MTPIRHVERVVLFRTYKTISVLIGRDSPHAMYQFIIVALSDSCLNVLHFLITVDSKKWILETKDGEAGPEYFVGVGKVHRPVRQPVSGSQL